MRIPQTLNHANFIKNLLLNLRKKENIPKISEKLNKTIRNDYFYDNDVVKWICLEE